jgi:hypothetical protein
MTPDNGPPECEGRAPHHGDPAVNVEGLAHPTTNEANRTAAARRGVLATRGRALAASCYRAAPVPPVGPVPDVATVFVGTLLWSAPAEVAAVLELVADDDLEAPALSVVLSSIRALAADHRPCDAGLVADELRRTASLTAPVAAALAAATVAGASPEAARFYAAAVVSDAFRRRVESAGHALIAVARDSIEAHLAATVSRATVACLDCAGRLAELRGEA